MKTSGIEISIKEFEDKYEIISFILKEELGGLMANGELQIITKPEDTDINFYDLTITMSDDSGYKLEFSAYAYQVAFDRMSLIIKFICCKPAFTVENRVSSFKSVLQAINSNWNGNLEYKPGTDIECDIHQRSETGFQLVSKLIAGLRNRSAYGFRCNEIIIRDLDNNYDLELEENLSIPIQPLLISKSKVKDLEVKTEDIGVCQSITYSKVFRQVRKEYSELYKNYFVNNALMKALGAYRIPIKYTRFETKLKIGQIVKHKVKDYSVDSFLVFSKVTMWAKGKGISTDIELIGYDWESLKL